MGKVHQWATNAEKTEFSAVGSSATELPAGFYKVIPMQASMFSSTPAKLQAFTPVTDALIPLPNSEVGHVVEGIEKFWANEKIYKEFGVTHKRAYLLAGDPGVGKTATAMIVGQEMVGRGGIVVCGDVEKINDLRTLLAEIREIEPERPLVLILEDLDRIKGKLTNNILPLCSLLDGEDSINNLVVIATTNYPEKLDWRIKSRPSRFDEVITVKSPNAEARLAYFRTLLGGNHVSDDTVAEWVKVTENLHIAHLKEFVISVQVQGQPMTTVVERLQAMMPGTNTGDAEKPKVPSNIAYMLKNIADNLDEVAGYAEEE